MSKYSLEHFNCLGSWFLFSTQSICLPQLNVDLFRPKNGGDRETGPFGTDALALDIMRSRDHGLAGYVHYLNACRETQRTTDRQAAVPAVSTWEELESLFATKVCGSRNQRDL